MNSLTITSVCLSLATLAIAPLAAQGNTRTFAAVRTSNYGVQQAGGSTTLRGTATVTTPTTLLGATTLAAGVSNTANVRLFGLGAEAAAMVANYRADHTLVGFSNTGPLFQNNATGSFAVRLAGMTVVSSTSTSNIQSGNLAADVFPSAGIPIDVSLLGLSIRVRGNVTARAAYSLTPSLVFNSGMAVDLNGPLRASAVGRASASVSALGASAGTVATMTFANTNGTAAFHITPAAASGSINYSVQPIQLALSVYASLALPLLPTMSASTTLFSYSAAAQSGVLNLSEI